MESTLMVAAIQAESGEWESRESKSGALGSRKSESGEEIPGQPLSLAEKDSVDAAFEKKMEMLRQVILEGVRTGDAYTRYSRNQYLVLLAGAKEADGKKVAERLEKRWKEIGGDGKTEASFAVYTVEGSGTEGCSNAEERDICSACDQSGERHVAGAGNLAG